ncbi:MAG TPA: hypothetical protein VH680_19780, partial [Gemmatimonadales bacterium]
MPEIARLTLTLAVVAGWAEPGYAQDSLEQAVMARERANTAHELTICAAYFMLVSQLPGLPDSTTEGLVAQSNLVGEQAISLSTESEV